MNHFKRLEKNDKLKVELSETDTTVIYLIRDPPVRNVDVVLYFDGIKECNKVKETFDCDSCCQKIFLKTLNQKRFEWTEIMPGTYLSKYSKRLLLFRNPDAPFSYILQHNKCITRKEYDDLMPALIQDAN